MAIQAQRLPRYGSDPRSASDWGGSRHIYRPHRPTATPLYPVVQHHLETFLAQATQSDRMGYGVPSWIYERTYGVASSRTDLPGARPGGQP